MTGLEFFTRVHVRPVPGVRTRGILRAGPLTLRCALGRAGLVRDKREGDGGTPVGRFVPLAAAWRADRLRRPSTALPLAPIDAGDGWCDAPRDRNYNRPVRLPYPASAERMARPDALYDIVVDLSANRRPIRKGRGSAIFLHVAAPDFSPTAGCIALERRTLVRLLARLSPRTVFVVG